jgi:hypothetical protein
MDMSSFQLEVVQTRSGPCTRLGFTAVLALLAVGTLAQSSNPDPVLAWNALMLDAIRTDDTAPTLATRNLAILHLAIYDAVNSVVGTHQPYRTVRKPPSDASAEAAAIAAGNEVMLALYPSFSTRTEFLFDSYRATLAATAAVTNGLSFGESVAGEFLDWRAADGSATSVPYIPSDSPGQWRRTPPFFRPPIDPQWRYVEPFCLPVLEPFVPPGPPPLDSTA